MIHRELHFQPVHGDLAGSGDDAGVVDQHVEPRVAGADRFGGLAHRSLGREVGDDDVRAGHAAGAREVARHPLPILPPAADEHQRGAQLSQALDGGASDAPGGPGDDAYATGHVGRAAACHHRSSEGKEGQRLVRRLLQLRGGAAPRVGGAEGVSGSGDGQEPGPCRRRGRRQPLAFQQRHRLVLASVHDEPGHRDSRRGRLDVEGGGVLLDIVEDVGVVGEDLPGPRVLHRGDAGLSPSGPLRLRPPLDRRDGGPRSERLHPFVAGREQHRHASAPRMPQQPDARRRSDAQLAPRQGVHHPAQVLQLGGEGVVAEALGEDELARVVHAAPAQIEGDGGEARPRQTVGELRP